MAARGALRSGLARRLSWLLAFRIAVATALLLLTVAADLSDWPIRRVSEVLYAVGVGTYVAVLLLALALRRGTDTKALAAAHLAISLVLALVVVEFTGGVVSPFPFLYMLAVLDGALLGGRRLALAIASLASVLFGVQISLQFYGIWPTRAVLSATASEYVGVIVIDLLAFYLVGWLGGELGVLLRRADEAVSVARTSLREVELLHGTVLGSLPIGVVTLDGKGGAELLNAAALEILGCSEPVRFVDELPRGVRELIASSARRREVEIEVGGRRRFVACWRAPLRRVERAGRGAPGQDELLLVEDRTETRALEQSLRDKQRLAALGELAAAIAHEIRNPLAAISGSFELLTGEMNDDEARATLEAVVHREIDRLGTLVNDFLLYARPPRAVRVSTDLAALARELGDVAERDAEHVGHAIHLEIPASLEAEVDAAEVRQMLWNLVRNAIEASPPDAPVTLRLERVERDGARYARWTVVDSGSGIAEEMREHLFEPFRTTKARGTGLGLAIVHRIVDAHGGEVSLQAAPGGGTAAVVTIPCAAPVAAAPGSSEG